jgi:hypothetical protein
VSSGHLKKRRSPYGAVLTQVAADPAARSSWISRCREWGSECCGVTFRHQECRPLWRLGEHYKVRAGRRVRSVPHCPKASRVAVAAVAASSTIDLGMRYWWVNQNQTFRHELGGGYLWSPKRKANGHRNPFYETMREVAPGNLVLSSNCRRARPWRTGPTTPAARRPSRTASGSFVGLGSSGAAPGT